MHYHVVIPAAGQGKRMKAGMNKQFIHLRDEPIIVHTVRAFTNDPWCDRIIVVASENEREEMFRLLSTLSSKKDIEVVLGGQERQQSVKYGLDVLENSGIVLIHDGARPFIDQEYIHRLVLKANEAGAATIAVPMKDTVKRVYDMSVVETVDRSKLWAIQTPQAFQTARIKTAHKKADDAGKLGTDDASLLEWMGDSVSIVEGDYMNIKITTPEDLVFAEAILNHKERV
ncbi:2-C-methyl-D-erythritol 4-phosphate cytidylyltransferase [Bacillus sp. FJAT-45037]|uniref:2-C-methyl-D-erythritol 4-phosphate cytidylyltransferase n=1 Tax=Bacillus sp. FJAT-45037 TaxID=2011007 RepID=UPI000C24BD86|nr:2-C-methyl-D-erythritol 4-phosphate cytidylyltransferase [Bacillus sp. FJAT-45037]